MGQLRMTGAEIAKRLDDMLAPTYAYDFKVIADTSDMVLLEATKGDYEGDGGTKLEYKVHRVVDYVEYGTAFYIVQFRAHTGWADDTRGDWRWSTHIDEPVPRSEMTINDVLAYDGLKLSRSVVINDTLVHPLTMISNANDWLTGHLREPFSYTDLLAVYDAVADIIED